jgi:hypothetical protein
MTQALALGQGIQNRMAFAQFNPRPGSIEWAASHLPHARPLGEMTNVCEATILAVADIGLAGHAVNVHSRVAIDDRHGVAPDFERIERDRAIAAEYQRLLRERGSIAAEAYRASAQPLPGIVAPPAAWTVAEYERIGREVSPHAADEYLQAAARADLPANLTYEVATRIATKTAGAVLDEICKLVESRTMWDEVWIHYRRRMSERQSCDAIAYSLEANASNLNATARPMRRTVVTARPSLIAVEIPSEWLRGYMADQWPHLTPVRRG